MVRISLELVSNNGKLETWNCGTEYIKINEATYRVESFNPLGRYFDCVDVTEEHMPIREELRDWNTFEKYYDRFVSRSWRSYPTS